MAEISRRAWLKGLALFSVTPAMLASTTAEAKVTKAAVHYETILKECRCAPHVQVLHRIGRQERWAKMGTGACQVVDGRISPMGYCDLYVPA